jgi:hypothetical protein
LDASGIEVPPPVIPRPQAIEGKKMRRIAIKKRKKGPIGISKCDIENDDTK